MYYSHVHCTLYCNTFLNLPCTVSPNCLNLLREGGGMFYHRICVTMINLLLTLMRPPFIYHWQSQWSNHNFSYFDSSMAQFQQKWLPINCHWQSQWCYHILLVLSHFHRLCNYCIWEQVAKINSICWYLLTFSSNYCGKTKFKKIYKLISVTMKHPKLQSWLLWSWNYVKEDL